MKRFYVGLGFIAYTIGFVSGLSNSPIVATLLPFLFTLITAGGNYALWSSRSGRLQQLRASIIGIQLIIFGTAFLLGLWTGVYVKFNPDRFWNREANRPAYTVFRDGAPSVMALLRMFDVKLLHDGIPFEERKDILRMLYENRGDWSVDEDEVIKWFVTGVRSLDEQPLVMPYPLTPEKDIQNTPLPPASFPSQ